MRMRAPEAAPPSSAAPAQVAVVVWYTPPAPPLLCRLEGDWISKILRRSTPFPVGTRLRVPWRIDTVGRPLSFPRLRSRAVRCLCAWL
jgi:hypothetical protein